MIRAMQPDPSASSHAAHAARPMPTSSAVPLISTSAATARHSPHGAASDTRFIKRCMLALLVVLSLGVCYVAQELLVPFALAILFALLLSPIVSLLQRLRLP